MNVITGLNQFLRNVENNFLDSMMRFIINFEIRWITKRRLMPRLVMICTQTYFNPRLSQKIFRVFECGVNHRWLSWFYQSYVHTLWQK